MAKRRGIVSELWLFIRENKAWWMTPIIIAVLLLTGLIILGAVGGGAAAPIIYNQFCLSLQKPARSKGIS
jgi:hypothetical protein